MKTLLFLRHAKSSWSDPNLGDHDRPLNARGRGAAAAMGHYIAANDLTPDLIFCSTAARARETLQRASAGWPQVPPTTIEAALYDFSGGEGYLNVIRTADNEAGSLMLVGHNPTIEILVEQLMGKAEPGLAEKLARKYPSGGLAVLEFTSDTWEDITPGTGHLVNFTIPKELDC